ncbi:hypothetical protein HID58_042118 [Brassica napus]|uniref:Secreted protein n=1 Tax=Brassica napus TaxID=3708 RepID=A0ABQ8BCS6_BRANA|nr:hypothetical protein HID58_042118 [Brassica napus]
MVNEPLSLTTTTSFIVVCVVCFFTVVQRRKVQVWLVVWQTGSKTANVDSVESTTPPINKPPWYVTLVSSFV